MGVDDKTVASIERLYADTSIPVAEIARRSGCSTASIRRLARRLGWPTRAARLGQAPRRTKLAKATTANAKASNPKAALMARLYAAATRQLEQMEKGMQTGDLSAADYERLAKSVSAMIGAMEKVAAVQDGGDGDTKPATEKQRAVPDVERRRHEIAERLERIARERDSRDGPGEPR